MKYESPITCHSKDMANVKVFADRQTDRLPPIFRYGGIKSDFQKNKRPKGLIGHLSIMQQKMHLI
jgi:hypothetical protein